MWIPPDTLFTTGGGVLSGGLGVTVRGNIDRARRYFNFLEDHDFGKAENITFVKSIAYTFRAARYA